MIAKMSEMFHHPIGSFELESNIERQFAETMHTVIANHAKKWTVAGEDPTISDIEIVTPRFDVEQQDGTVMSIRVRVMDQHFAKKDAMIASGYVTHESTARADCVGLVLEYAEYDQQKIEDYGENVDDYVPWKSYIFVGIEVTEETIVTTVLDAQTGKELNLEDLLSANNVLLALKANLEAEEFTSAMYLHYEIDIAPLDDEQAAPLTFEQKYADIFSENYIANKYCKQCDRPTVYCEHAIDIKN